MSELQACKCTCFLCAVYSHEAIVNTWWVSHTKGCPERIDSYVQIAAALTPGDTKLMGSDLPPRRPGTVALEDTPLGDTDD